MALGLPRNGLVQLLTTGPAHLGTQPKSWTKPEMDFEVGRQRPGADVAWGGDPATEAIPRNDMAPQNHDQEQLRSARGNTRSSDRTTPRPAWYHWTDPETGERLRVELWSSEAFLAGLESAGFEPFRGGSDAIERGHADSNGHGPDRTGGRSSVRSSAEATRDRDRAGSTPPHVDGDAA